MLEASLDNLRRVQTERKWHDACWLDSMLRMVQSRLQESIDAKSGAAPEPAGMQPVGTQPAEGVQPMQGVQGVPQPEGVPSCGAGTAPSTAPADAKGAAPRADAPNAPKAPRADRADDSPPTSVETETDASFEL